jgi:hypothetical protein
VTAPLTAALATGPHPALLWAKDTGERAIATFFVVVIPLLLTGKAIDASLAAQAGMAGIAAVWAVLFNAFGSMPAFVTGSVWLDLLIRSSRSAMQAMLGIVVGAGSGWLDVTVWQGALLAAGAALGSVVKGFFASRMSKNTITPASLASPPQSTVPAELVA